MGDVLPMRPPTERDTQQPERAPARPRETAAEPLWREVVGERLRARRGEREERLVDVAGRAGVSAQYISEVERGLKDPSSELLAAICGALDLTLADLTRSVHIDLSTPPLRTGRPTGPVALAA